MGVITVSSLCPLDMCFSRCFCCLSHPLATGLAAPQDTVSYSLSRGGPWHPSVVPSAAALEAVGWRCGLSGVLPLARGSSAAFHTTVPPPLVCLPGLGPWIPVGGEGLVPRLANLRLSSDVTAPRRSQSLSQSYQSSLTDPCSVCPRPLCCSDHLSLQQGMGTAGAPASWFAEATGRGGSAVTQPTAPGRREFPGRIGEAASEGPHRASAVLSRGGQEKTPRKPRQDVLG